MLKEWLQCKNDYFVVGFKAKRFVSNKRYHLGDIVFIKRKFDITSGAFGFPYIFLFYIFIEPSYEDKPRYSACKGWLNWALCFLERFLKVLFIFFFSLQSFYFKRGYYRSCTKFGVWLAVLCSLVLRERKMWKIYINMGDNIDERRQWTICDQNKLTWVVQVGRIMRQKESWRTPFQRILRIVFWNKALPYFMFLPYLLEKKCKKNFRQVHKDL